MNAKLEKIYPGFYSFGEFAIEQKGHTKNWLVFDKNNHFVLAAKSLAAALEALSIRNS